MIGGGYLKPGIWILGTAGHRLWCRGKGAKRVLGCIAKGLRVTIDEELNLLEDNIRKLKVEYDVYFAGGARKPPDDIEWRIRNAINKHNDGRAFTFPQQFRYNSLAQKYAVFSDLWRRKLKIKEEGYRRPQDALLAIQGLRPEQEHAAEAALGVSEKRAARRIKPSQYQFADPLREMEKARLLYQALVEARRRAGLPPAPAFDSFREFLSNKTAAIREQFGCAMVEYSVEQENGHIRLKVRGKS
jgi:hypothetical protein